MAEPVILFGAFDRHNLGDLLFAHLAAALIRPRATVIAGLAERDLTEFGGHRVRAIANLAREWGAAPAHVLHVGGELLTCDLYEAAVMLLPPEEARTAIARYDSDRQGRLAWAQTLLGLDQSLAYLVPRALFANPGRLVYQAVGGVNLPGLPEALREEALARLREADYVSVRDRVTAGHLAAAGIEADLAPDPAVLTAACFGSRIRDHAQTGEPARVRAAFPQGYLAVQCSADFGDDATLEALAAQLDQVIKASGLGIALFRAGAAPWHDDPGVYRRLLQFMRSGDVHLFESLNLWDICALLAHARAYCGSSLHGRIVAAAFGVPGVNLLRTDQVGKVTKQAAYAATWHAGEADSVAGADGVGACLGRAIAQDRTALLEAARGREEAARRASQTLAARLGT